MTVNIVGPHGPGINETTTRPTDTESGSALDTWFKDCFGGVAGTGTRIPAVWLNKITALMREAIRGRGVDEDETDDQMLLKAIASADKGIEGLGAADGASVVNLYAGLKSPDLDTHLIRKVKAGTGITLAVESGTGELVITATGATPTLATLAPIMILHETRAGNAAASAFPIDTWVHRVLNTVVANTIVGASVASGVVTLPAGTYRVEAEAMARQAGSHRVRLYNLTAAAAIITGLTGDSNTGSGSNATCSSSRLVYRFTLAVESAIRLEHRNGGAVVESRLGDDSNIAPDNHIDAMLSLVKEA